jgi:hypothetical protein
MVHLLLFVAKGAAKAPTFTSVFAEAPMKNRRSKGSDDNVEFWSFMEERG